MGYADLEKTEKGFLVNLDDWNEDVAKEIAAAEDLHDLSDKHWDLIKFLRDEYVNNNGNQPNERNMVKAMADIWGEKPSTKDLYTLFPMQPSKQATKIAGLPETKRKGGY
ncbi:TusE/DsrC/DsvC family sulfur relay protein [Magnetovibrio blakemorei]|uniref:Sulfur relay protein DsrC n=1 Tax=Magnetovibrio blakemorei TaxID=28181 RepID=A0A1E5Q8L6_9PROT|nr:TusE/DsrC/DsvC family sulfur relay protein [Magnetovibrio blakemorei]OEJ67739.1 sulfur relay protein DsrC [Magnetovibrio blakemorei]